MNVIGPKGKLFAGKRRQMELIAMLGPDTAIQPLADQEVFDDGVAGSDVAGSDSGIGGHRGKVEIPELPPPPPAKTAVETLEPPPEPSPPAKKRKEKTPTKEATQKEPVITRPYHARRF